MGDTGDSTDSTIVSYVESEADAASSHLGTSNSSLFSSNLQQSENNRSYDSTASSKYNHQLHSTLQPGGSKFMNMSASISDIQESQSSIDSDLPTSKVSDTEPQKDIVQKNIVVTCSIFDRIATTDRSKLADLTSDLLKKFKAKDADTTKELIELFLNGVGYSEEIEAYDENLKVINQVLTDLYDGKWSTKNAKLLSTPKEDEEFKFKFKKFISLLIDQSIREPKSYQKLYLVLTIVMQEFSTCKSPEIRKLAAFLTNPVNGTLLKIQEEVTKSHFNTANHFEVETNKPENHQSAVKIARLRKMLMKLTKTKKFLMGYLNSMYSKIFMQQLRDTNKEVTKICVANLYSWIKTYPLCVLHESLESFLQILLSHPTWEVRSESLKVLQICCELKDAKVGKHIFYKCRRILITMINDVKPAVASGAIDLILVGCKSWDFEIMHRKHRDAIFKLTFSKHKNIATAAGNFLSCYLERTKTGKMSLVMLAKFCVARKMDDRVEDMIEALSAEFLTDWKAIVEILLDKAHFATKNGVKDKILVVFAQMTSSLICKACTGTAHNATLSSSKKNTVKKKAKNMVTKSFLPHLANLVYKYSENDLVLAELLSICQFLDITPTPDQIPKYLELIARISNSTVFMKHPLTLRNCGKTLKYLSEIEKLYPACQDIFQELMEEINTLFGQLNSNAEKEQKVEDYTNLDHPIIKMAFFSEENKLFEANTILNFIHQFLSDEDGNFHAQISNLIMYSVRAYILTCYSEFEGKESTVYDNAVESTNIHEFIHTLFQILEKFEANDLRLMVILTLGKAAKMVKFRLLPEEENFIAGFIKSDVFKVSDDAEPPTEMECQLSMSYFNNVCILINQRSLQSECVNTLIQHLGLVFQHPRWSDARVQILDQLKLIYLNPEVDYTRYILGILTSAYGNLLVDDQEIGSEKLENLKKFAAESSVRLNVSHKTHEKGVSNLHAGGIAFAFDNTQMSLQNIPFLYILSSFSSKLSSSKIKETINLFSKKLKDFQLELGSKETKITDIYSNSLKNAAKDRRKLKMSRSPARSRSRSNTSTPVKAVSTKICYPALPECIVSQYDRCSNGTPPKKSFVRKSSKRAGSRKPDVISPKIPRKPRSNVHAKRAENLPTSKVFKKPSLNLLQSRERSESRLNSSVTKLSESTDRSSGSESPQKSHESGSSPEMTSDSEYPETSSDSESPKISHEYVSNVPKMSSDHESICTERSFERKVPEKNTLNRRRSVHPENNNNKRISTQLESQESSQSDMKESQNDVTPPRKRQKISDSTSTVTEHCFSSDYSD